MANFALTLILSPQWFRCAVPATLTCPGVQSDDQLIRSSYRVSLRQVSEASRKASGPSKGVHAAASVPVRQPFHGLSMSVPGTAGVPGRWPRTPSATDAPSRRRRFVPKTRSVLQARVLPADGDPADPPTLTARDRFTTPDDVFDLIEPVRRERAVEYQARLHHRCLTCGSLRATVYRRGTRCCGPRAWSRTPRHRTCRESWRIAEEALQQVKSLKEAGMIYAGVEELKEQAHQAGLDNGRRTEAELPERACET